MKSQILSRYYLVWAMTDEPSIEDDEWLRQFREKHTFPCGHDDFDAWEDLVVIRELGANVPFNFMSRVGYHYVRSDLRNKLSPELATFLKLGTISHSSGGSLHELTTLWADLRPRIRGGPKSQRSFCPTCGQLIYYPMGNWYVLGQELIGAPLFLSDMGGLIVDERLHARLAATRWRKLDIRPLTVLEQPRDNLPADLTTLNPSDL